MAKYSTQALDRISKDLKNDNIKTIPIETESVLLDKLIDRRNWPREWQTSSFAPTGNFNHALSVLDVVYPNTEWQLRYNSDTETYESYIGDKKYSVFSANRTRSLILAIWHYHLLSAAETEKGT